MSGDRRFDITGVQVVASVLATVTGTVAASYLGIAGTIVGAAVMSAASTVGAAVYRHYLGRGADRLRETPPVVAAHRAAERMSSGTRTMPHRAPADASAQDSKARGQPGPRPEAGRLRRWSARLRRRPGWLMAAVAAVAVFAGVVGGITVFEVAAGKPLNAVVWNRHGTGTTVGGLVGGQPSHSTVPTTHPAPASTGSSSPSPGGTGTGSTGPSPTPSSGSPSPTKSTSPSATPTPSPTPTRKRHS